MSITSIISRFRNWSNNLDQRCRDIAAQNRNRNKKTNNQQTNQVKQQQTKDNRANAFVMDEVLSKRHGTYGKHFFEDKHSIFQTGLSVKWTGDQRHPDTITVKGESGITYVYQNVALFKDKEKLSRNYVNNQNYSDDYVLISATKPDGTDVMSKGHYEVYHLTIDDFEDPEMAGIVNYNLTQPKGYDGSGKSSINVRA